MKWIYTLNDQIINLDNFESFWIEHVPNDEFHIFGCDNHKIEWKLAEFHSLKIAREYLDSKIWYEISGLNEAIQELKERKDKIDSLDEVLRNVGKN